MKKMFVFAALLSLGGLAHTGNKVSMCLMECAESPATRQARHLEEFKHALKDGNVEEFKKAYWNIQPRTNRGRMWYSFLSIAKWCFELAPLQHQEAKIAFLAEHESEFAQSYKSYTQREQLADGRQLLEPTSDN